MIMVRLIKYRLNIGESEYLITGLSVDELYFERREIEMSYDF